MLFLPASTSLGTLEISEVYDYYDRPCLFSCHNTVGDLFLALSIDENFLFHRWLYLAVTGDRLQAIKSGDITLKSAFVAENSKLFDVKIFCNNTSTVNLIIGANLPDDLLPADGVFLSCDRK